MSETMQTERDGSRHTAEMSEAQQVGMATTGEFMLRLLNDADRLARVEKEIEEVADSPHWSTVRDFADRLRAIINGEWEES